MYWAVAWYTAAMQLFTLWMCTGASRLNQSKLIHVNAVIVKIFEYKALKKTDSFCDVIKGWWSSTCGPREISIPWKFTFFKPCPQINLLFFWPLKNRFGLFWPLFSSVWLFIDISIWQPCKYVLVKQNKMFLCFASFTVNKLLPWNQIA